MRMAALGCPLNVLALRSSLQLGRSLRSIDREDSVLADLHRPLSPLGARD